MVVMATDPRRLLEAATAVTFNPERISALVEMSVRYTRPLSGRSGANKTTTSKKKTQVRQCWDSSIHDLGVHRASPEELAHHHEIHKSKNQSLAQWELKKKLIKQEWRRQNGGTPDTLEDTRLALMMEILSEQYQMKDVLERLDRAMAVVKDLFGDAPFRHTGFPHVTVAPSCDLETSRGPIAQKKDPPTHLSILSESIMDSQALNEVEEIQSEDSNDDDDDDVEVSISFQPELHTDKFRRILDEERCRLTSEQWSRSRDKELNTENPLVTPKGAGHLSNDQTALNATAAVNKVKSRLTEKEQEEPETSSVIGRILNPQPINHRKLQSKGKKKRPPHVSSGQRAAPPPASGCSQSGLDVLNQMIQEVERERETGREVSSMPHSQGLTGFTLSLVSSIKRLVSYLKESDRQLRQEAVERQRLKDELSEQRLLIDALTVEILAIKDGCSLSPGSHQLMSDQSQSPAGQMSTSLPMGSPEQTEAPTGSAHTVGFMTDHGLQSVEERGDSAAPHPGHDASIITQMTTFGAAASLPAFEPAIMLSPPRQKSRAGFSGQSSLLLGSHDVVSSSSGKDFPDPAAQRRMLPCVAVRQGDTFIHHQLESQESNSTATDDDDIVSWMAELTCQNNALEAQLTQLSYKSGRAGDSADASRVAAENKGSHQLMSDQSQSPAGQMSTSLPMGSPEQTEAPTGSAHTVGFMTDHGLRSVEERGDSAAPHPGHDASIITQMTTFGAAASLPAFEPAIMLSPPRQKSRAGFSGQSSLLLGSHDVVSSSSGKDFPDPAAQRRMLPCVAVRQGDPFIHHQLESQESNSTATDDDDIVSRMAELTCQNNALKAQLTQLSYKSGRAGDSADASRVAAENKQETSSRQSPVTLEMRIAEARDKLLKLIEQQKQFGGLTCHLSHHPAAGGARRKSAADRRCAPNAAVYRFFY